MASPTETALLTSAEAALALHVSVSSIKRWTDDGALASVRTVGGHRRYTAAALHAFARERGLPVADLPPLPAERPRSKRTLYEALTKGDAPAVHQLIEPPSRAPETAAEFFDLVATSAMREIGERWETGEVSVECEHRASHLLENALDRMRPATARGKLALLVCPPDEWHELPLRMVRLILEWSGWRTELLGAALPWADARRAVARSRAALIGFSSRTGAPFQSAEFERLLAFARGKGTTVIAGGEWARGGSGADEGFLRFRTLRGFERWLRRAG